MEKKHIILCAGGTGGHLFPAIATANALLSMGHRVSFFSDDRAQDYFKEEDIPLYIIDSATPTQGGFLGKIKSAFLIFKGIMQSRRYFKELKPDAIIGFGGYPTVPPLLAAQLGKIPLAIHDQNMILGRANRMLSRYANKIGVINDRVRGIPASAREKMVITGNPLRKSVLIASERHYPMMTAQGRIRLLIFGGSQGARILSQIVPETLVSLPSFIRSRLDITQQTRPEDMEKAEQIYQSNGINAHIAPFFDDLPKKMADAHLVIARSGATTVTELAAIGRPSILIPLAASLDGDQAENAKILALAGGAWIIPENEFDQNRLSGLLMKLLIDRGVLINAARSAQSVANTDGAERLAKLALDISK